MAWLVGPQKEVAVPGVALVELATLVGAVLAHGQEDGILTAVTHDDVAVGVAAATTQWRFWLWGPGWDRGKGRPGI